MTIHPNGVATIDGDTAHGVWCKTEGLIHDRWMASQVCHYIKPGDIVVQGGANIGTLTRAILDAGADVYCFEPNKEAVECLKHNCPEARVEPSAVWSGEEWRNFTRDQYNAGASFIGSSKGDTLCISIDYAFAHEQGKISLILLDVEGSEVHALRGAAQTIARCRPVIICEVNRGALERAGSTDAELLGLIEDMGYSISIMQPDCRIGDPQFDIVCIPK